LEILTGRTLCDPCHRKTPTYGFRVHVEPGLECLAA
jgi:hypothetical protein